MKFVVLDMFHGAPVPASVITELVSVSDLVVEPDTVTRPQVWLKKLVVNAPAVSVSVDAELNVLESPKA